jgi:hypothetical protein
MIIFLLTFLLLTFTVVVAIALWPVTLTLVAIGALIVFGWALLIWGGTIIPVILLFVGITLAGAAVQKLPERYPWLNKKL